MILRQAIVDYFNYLGEITNLFITGIEVKPISIKKDMYITGFRRIGLTFIEAHVQHIKRNIFKTTDYTMEMPLKSEAEEEIWMDIELLSKDIVKSTFNHLKNYVTKLDSFEILTMEYRDITNNSDYITHEENVIFDDKKVACKTAIKKRKTTTNMKTKFTHYGNNTNNMIQIGTHKLTDEEFAETALI